MDCPTGTKLWAPITRSACNVLRTSLTPLTRNTSTFRLLLSPRMCQPLYLAHSQHRCVTNQLHNRALFFSFPLPCGNFLVFALFVCVAQLPTMRPSEAPTPKPTPVPSPLPTISLPPSPLPTLPPSILPTPVPSTQPSEVPTLVRGRLFLFLCRCMSTSPIMLSSTS